MAAYYTLQEKKYEYLTPAYISSYLRNLVPVYMIPAKIVCVEQMPLNANKKIDYTKLAQMREDTLFIREQQKVKKNLKASVKYVLDVMREALSNPEFIRRTTFLQRRDFNQGNCYGTEVQRSRI